MTTSGSSTPTTRSWARPTSPGWTPTSTCCATRLGSDILLAPAVVPRRVARALRGRRPRVRRVGRPLRLCAPRGRVPHRGSSPSVPAAWIRRSLRTTAICCWPRSNATPRMRGRSSTWPRATSIWAVHAALYDFVNARKWYARRVEMGGWDEEVYFAMFRVAESMAQLGAPWPDVQDAYLRAWEFRPTRAEPLYAIARAVPRRSALPARLPVRQARRRNPVSRTGPTICPRRRLRLARNRRAGGVRILDRQAGRGVHAVAAPAGPTRPPRRGSAKDHGQPRRLCADDDRSGVVVPRRAGAAPGRRRTRGRGGRQPDRRAGSG